MKKALVVLALLLMPAVGWAQCKKTPGESGNFTWTFPAASESQISGFRLYSSPIQSGPFNNLVGSNQTPTSRAMTAAVNFAAGTVRTFYVVRSYFTSGGGTVESSDSNSVECERNVVPATNLQVQ